MKTKRAKRHGFAKATADTPRGRVILPEWVHVREDLLGEIVDVLECVKAHCSGETAWLSDEAAKLLKELPRD